MTAKAPNILIVMADQMAPAFLPIYGHALTRAPNMQALAQQRRRLRQRLLQQSPLLAVARVVHVRPAAVAHPRLRQCGGVRSRCPDLRALPETPRLSDNSIRKNAFLRAGSIARVRRAADDRYLSRRLRLDAGLGPSRASSELVSQHELGPAGRRLRAHQPTRLRRRSRLHGRARDLRYRALQRSAAVSARGLVLASARSLRRAAALLGPLSRFRHRHAGAGNRARGARRPFATPAPAFAPWTPNR